MPKEYIDSMDFDIRVVPEGGSEPVLIDRNSIKVSWSKEGYHLGLCVIGDREEDPDGMKAQYINLDRAGVNRLIRFLRQGRNDAFGKDE